MEKLKQRMVELIGNDDGIWLFDNISVILDENNVSENSKEKICEILLEAYEDLENTNFDDFLLLTKAILLTLPDYYE
jgi:hypothetical protein